jgi:hypothetical protein
MRKKSTPKADHHHHHSELDDLVRIIKELETVMLAQVQAIVDSSTALKTASDAVVAFVTANPPITQADLDALTSVNTTISGVTTALNALVAPKP